jgi:hypothetical protein
MAANPGMVVRIAANLLELRRNLAEGKNQIELTTAGMEKLARSLDGSKLEQRAHNITAAINEVGGVTKLTDAEAKRHLKTLDAWIEKAKRLGQEIPADIQKTADSLRRAEEATTALSVATGVLAANLVQHAARSVMEYGKQALMTSARVETLGGVAKFMGAQSGFTAREIDALTAAMVRQGITTAQANDTVTQMTRANLNLADATKLAAVAQSLARATGENSSDTLQRLIQGTQTLNVRVLRTAGVVMQLDQEYKNFAKTNNRTVESLSAQEKQQIALSAVLREGERVAGVYGVTNEFVGGKIQSMARHQEEAAKAIGDVFKPALKLGVDVLTEFLKLVQSAPALFGGLGVATIGLATAFTTLKGAAALGVISTTALTTALGLLWPAVAVGATAFAAWKLGGWIGEVTRATNAVEWLTGRMMGLSTEDINASRAAREFQQSVEGKAHALKSQEQALASLEEKARAAAEAEREFGIAEQAAAAATTKAAEELKKFKAAQDQLFGRDLIQRALEYAAQLGDLSNITKLSADKKKELHTAVTVAIDAYERLGMVAPQSLREIKSATTELIPVTRAFAAAAIRAFATYRESVEDAGEAIHNLFSRTVPDAAAETARLNKELEEWARQNGAVYKSVEQVTAKVEEQIPKLEKLGAALKANLGKVLDDIPKTIADGFIHGNIEGAVKSIVSQVGKAVGSAVGSMFGPLGEKIGAAVGSMAGLLVNPFKKLFGIGVNAEVKKANVEIEKFRQSLLKQHGTLENLEEQANKVGISFRANWGHQGQAGLKAFSDLMEEFEKRTRSMADAQSELAKLRDEARHTFAEMQADAELLGINFAQLGPIFQQAKIDETSTKYVNALQRMIDTSGDAGAILSRASGNISELVQQALQFGTTLPENMREWIEELARSGQLVDANGEALTDLTQLRFGPRIATETELITAAMEKLEAVIDRLATALTNLRMPDLNLPSLPGEPTLPGTRPRPIPEFAHGSGGIRDFGSGTLAMLHGREEVRTEAQVRSSSSSGPIILRAVLQNGRQLMDFVIDEGADRFAERGR